MRKANKKADLIQQLSLVLKAGSMLDSSLSSEPVALNMTGGCFQPAPPQEKKKKSPIFNASTEVYFYINVYCVSELK